MRKYKFSATVIEVDEDDDEIEKAFEIKGRCSRIEPCLRDIKKAAADKLAELKTEKQNSQM